MARLNRRDVFNPLEVSVFHCIQRVVRRAMLCGKDPDSGKSYEHRRQLIRDRLEELAGIFGMDVLGFAIMGNHLHCIIRNRPDVVRTWSDEEVARRWWRLFPKRRDKRGNPLEPMQQDLKRILGSQAETAEKRRRLSDISWVMRCLAEYISRRANQEDQCKGRFWEGRFKCQKLADETAILACSAYVDLNPVRAGLADTPEESDFTSVQERIRSEQAEQKHRKNRVSRGPKRRRVSAFQRQDRWLAPVELPSRGRAGVLAAQSSRASDKGFLSMSLRDYLKLLDWTGRRLVRDKQHRIPPSLAPILDRIGVTGEVWCQLVSEFGKLFRRTAGTRKTLEAEAAAANQKWLQAPGAALLA